MNAWHVTGGALVAIAIAAADIASGQTLLHALPDPVTTPGALNAEVTQDSIGATICRRGWTASIRPAASYTGEIKREQLAENGYPDRQASHYEEDHRVPLELGGAPLDPRNLWPEPWAEPFGAHDKDRLENAVRRDVCSGRITLEAGRAIFLGNWYEAYVDRFGEPQ